MRTLLFASASLLSSLAEEPGDNGLFGPVVETENGKVQGYVRRNLDKDVDCFLGMPYAAPPMGENRFRPPQPFTDSWAPKTREAKTPRQICDQLDMVGNLHIGGEDCLYVNVYRPSGATADSLLPVFFWIYGGGYFIGDGIEFTLYDGTHLVKKHEYVVVNHNYRLSGFGFMALPELAAEDPDGTTGNYGVQDQRAALQWVQRNIRNFGGNPGRVTIAGESAGAFSVTWHTVSKASAGLFHAAIMESGTSHNNMFFQNMSQAFEFYEEWSEILGCPRNDQRLACLRQLPQKDFMLSFAQMAKDEIARITPFPLPDDIPDFASPLWPLMPFGPVIDGTDVGLHDQPYNLMQRGEFTKVPLIVGANKDGGAYFGAALPLLWGDWHFNFTKTVEWFLPNKDDQQQALELYGDASFPSDRYRMNRFIRDLTFQCSDRDVATAWTAAGQRAYLYVFSFDFTGFMEKTFGDAHAFELPFVWRNTVEVLGSLSKNGTVAGYEHMADIMSCSWASFVNCQTPKCVAAPPNCKDVLQSIPDWPVFSAATRKYMSLKSEPTVETVQGSTGFLEDEFPGDDRCDFIKNIDMDWQPIKSKVQRVWLDSAKSAKVVV